LATLLRAAQLRGRQAIQLFAFRGALPRPVFLSLEFLGARKQAGDRRGRTPLGAPLRARIEALIMPISLVEGVTMPDKKPTVPNEITSEGDPFRGRSLMCNGIGFLGQGDEGGKCRARRLETTRDPSDIQRICSKRHHAELGRRGASLPCRKSW